MNSTKYIPRLAVGLALTGMLAACGGGGGSPGRTMGTSVNSGNTGATPTPARLVTPPVVTPAPDGCAVHIVSDTAITVGGVGGASALSCGAPLADITWTQISGPSVLLQATRSPTVSFEPVAAGPIRLRADAVLADGTIHTSTVDIAVGAAPTTSYVASRVDHSVRSGMSTSVRAQAVVRNDTIQSISWTQVAGPSVTLDTSVQDVLIFTAPDVSRDTALIFRATLRTQGGTVDTDDVIVSVERQAAAPAASLLGTVERVHPYRQATVYAPVLARCTYDASLFIADDGSSNTCTSGTLPLLQAEAGTGAIPTVAQVMGRVLVSHDFLGANFERFLIEQDTRGDFRRLLGATSAIVIGAHVRPSFYQVGTGAIYLDAGYLWLTAAERDVVTEVPDYREAYAEPLNFTQLARDIVNNTYARQYVPISERAGRGTDQLIFGLGSLLYHELAHAGDFLPPGERVLNPTLSIYDNAAPRIYAGAFTSDLLAQQYPLLSAEWRGLGKVLYRGETPTTQQRAYSATEVGAFFGADRASDDYAYSIFGSGPSYEDTAMLFQTFMMYHRHGVKADQAYVDKLSRDGNAGTAVVRWGQRGRIGDAAIKPRLRLVVQRIAPWIDLAAVDALPAPVMFRPGVSWDGSLAELGANGTMSGISAKRIGVSVSPGGRDDIKVARPHGVLPRQRQP